MKLINIVTAVLLASAISIAPANADRPVRTEENSDSNVVWDVTQTAAHLAVFPFVMGYAVAVPIGLAFHWAVSGVFDVAGSVARSVRRMDRSVNRSRIYE